MRETTARRCSGHTDHTHICEDVADAGEWGFSPPKCRAAHSASLPLFWEQQPQGCREAAEGAGLEWGHPLTPIPQTVLEASGPRVGRRWHGVHRASVCKRELIYRLLLWAHPSSISHVLLKKKGKVKFLCLHSSVCAIVPGGTGAPAARHSPALSRTSFTP